MKIFTPSEFMNEILGLLKQNPEPRRQERHEHGIELP